MAGSTLGCTAYLRDTPQVPQRRKLHEAIGSKNLGTSCKKRFMFGVEKKHNYLSEWWWLAAGGVFGVCFCDRADPRGPWFLIEHPSHPCAPFLQTCTPRPDPCRLARACRRLSFTVLPSSLPTSSLPRLKLLDLLFSPSIPFRSRHSLQSIIYLAWIELSRKKKTVLVPTYYTCNFTFSPRNQPSPPPSTSLSFPLSLPCRRHLKRLALHSNRHPHTYVSTQIAKATLVRDT